MRRKEQKTLWYAGCVEKTHSVKAFGSEISLPMEWAEGMIGVIPVFDSESAAKKYAGDLEVFRITVEPVE